MKKGRKDFVSYSEEKKRLERNIPLLYSLAGLSWGRFFVPVLALFYVASQVSIEQFTIIMAVFAITILVLEIPSGVFADTIGKKNSLIISKICYLVEIVLIAFFDGFLLFLIAKIISGVGVSLTSGTSHALLYDSLKQLGRKSEHKTILGTQTTIMYSSMAVVFITGSFLFSIHHKLPAIASIPFAIITLVVALFLYEPIKRTKELIHTSFVKKMMLSVSEFFSRRKLMYLAFFSFIVGSTGSIILSLSSAYFEAINIPLSLIGTVAFVGVLLSAMSARTAHKTELFFGEKKTFFYTSILTCISVFLMAWMIEYYSVLFYLLIPLIAGFFEVVVNDYVNNHISSNNRATMLSINNMFVNLGVSILFPIMGFMIGAWGFSTALFLYAVFLTTLTSILVLTYSWQIIQPMSK